MEEPSGRLHLSSSPIPRVCQNVSDGSVFAYLHVDAEPLHRYRTGGYHPICLGDILKDGRYRILHKLGRGGYSTVWAARDQRFGLSLPFDRREAYKLPENNNMLPPRYLCPNAEKAAANSKSHPL
jgi:hypothetical protein